jgi:NAD(P)-dependent dehydrogenase (short-subunit alcohol dehydrogenase family)
MPDNEFFDKVCVITGGASGLGRELGKQLAASGARVVLSDIDDFHLSEAVAEIAGSGGKVQAVQVDVADPDSVRALVEQTAKTFGRIDYFFNNAGVSIPGEIRDLALEQWRRVINVNLFGEIYGVHHVYPVMIRQGFGHIINTASGLGMAPWPLTTPNVASKFAIYGLTHALRAEARQFGIDVSLVCPGFVQTAMVQNMTPLNASAVDFAPLRRLKPMPVESAAKIMLNGVARKRFLITFPAYVRIGALLHRLLPSLFNWLALRQVSAFRKIRRVAALEELGDGAPSPH